MLTVAALLSRSEVGAPGHAPLPEVSMGAFAAQSASMAQMLLDAARATAPERYAQAIEALQFGGRTRLVVDAPAPGIVRVRLRVLRAPNDPNADECGNFWCYSHDIPMSSLVASGGAGAAVGAEVQDERLRWLLPV